MNRVIRAEYRYKDWKIADAFLPNPVQGRGYLKATVDDTYTDEQIVEAARMAVPPNNDLWVVEVFRPEERLIWSRNLDGTEGFVKEEQEAVENHE